MEDRKRRCGAFALWHVFILDSDCGSEIDKFKSFYGVEPAANTDAQRKVIQADITKKLIELNVQVSDLQGPCIGATAAEVQDCTKEKLESLKGAESALDDAMNVAVHYDYDGTVSSSDVMAYRNANKKSQPAETSDRDVVSSSSGQSGQ